MSEKAFVETRDAVAKQFQEWGVDGGAEIAAREVQRVAVVEDKRAEHRPPAPDPVDPESLSTLQTETKYIKTRVQGTEFDNWALERAHGFAPPRVGFAQRPDKKAIGEFWTGREERMRQRLS